MTNTERANLNGPLTALVEYQIRSEAASNEEWLDVWHSRADDALISEPETSAYEAALSQDAPHNVLVFERYAKGQASLDAHMQRPAHQQLIDTMGARNMTKRRVMSNLYEDIADYGWWHRSERTRTCTAKDILLTLIVTRFPDPETRERYIALTGEHAQYCQTQEPDTLVYSGGIAVRDADRGPQIRKGDLMFIAAFADEAAAITHRDDPQHLALQPKLAELNRERVCLQHYRTSGSGFLWKPGQ